MLVRDRTDVQKYMAPIDDVAEKFARKIQIRESLPPKVQKDSQLRNFEGMNVPVWELTQDSQGATYFITADGMVLVSKRRALVLLSDYFDRHAFRAYPMSYAVQLLDDLKLVIGYLKDRL